LRLLSIEHTLEDTQFSFAKSARSPVPRFFLAGQHTLSLEQFFLVTKHTLRTVWFTLPTTHTLLRQQLSCCTSTRFGSIHTFVCLRLSPHDGARAWRPTTLLLFFLSGTRYPRDGFPLWKRHTL